MDRRWCLMALLLLLVSTACYHALIDTELEPSMVILDKSFAASWIFGLVPPKSVSTASKCSNGVAKVETWLSFPNQLVGFLTLGIYTPMHIKVTCAGSQAALEPTPAPDLVVSEGADDEEIIQAMQAAAEQAVQLGRPVFVQF